jgi:hypothetical protein
VKGAVQRNDAAEGTDTLRTLSGGTGLVPVSVRKAACATMTDVSLAMLLFLLLLLVRRGAAVGLSDRRGAHDIEALPAVSTILGQGCGRAKPQRRLCVASWPRKPAGKPWRCR